MDAGMPQGLFRLAMPEGRETRGYQPRVYAYYYKHWEDWRMPAQHRHPSTEVMYVMGGTCTIEVGESTFELKKSEFVVVGPDVPHRLIVDGACRMLNVEFGFVPDAGNGEGADLPVSFRALADGEPSLGRLLADPAAHLVLKDPDEVYRALRSLVTELDVRGLPGSGLARMLLAQLVIRIARLREETASVGAFEAEDRYVRRSLEYLRQHYDRPIQVRDVAAAVNLHPGYLQRIFKAVTGRTLVEALTAIRIDKAKMLLRQTAIPATDIYEYVGVGSRQYFHALFKKHTGFTPQAYRQSAAAAQWGYPADG